MESETLNTRMVKESGNCAGILRRPRPESGRLQDLPLAAADSASVRTLPRDWTPSHRYKAANPHRFSDPLKLHPSLNLHALTPPSATQVAAPSTTITTQVIPAGRAGKACSWYLDNALPAGFSRSRAGLDAPHAFHSLFLNTESDEGLAETICQPAGMSTEAVNRRKSCNVNVMSYTWERVRRQQQHDHHQHQVYPLSQTLDYRLSAGRRAQGIPSPQSGKQRGGQCDLTSGGKSFSFGSQRSSPGGSQRASPSGTPQGSLKRLSPCSTMSLYVPGSRLSPTQFYSTFTSSPRTASFQALASRSSFTSPSYRNSSTPVFQLSPFSSSPASSQVGDDSCDVSYGSETDDDFFYVSCQQMTQDLADLAISTAAHDGQESLKPPLATGAGHNHVVLNPAFEARDSAVQAADRPDDDELDLDGYSDDALSDDVFLDNPVPPVLSTVSGGSMQRSTVTPGMFNYLVDCDGEIVLSDDKDTRKGMEEMIVESLRKNSIQSKLRQTWKHRRHKPPTDPSSDNPQKFVEMADLQHFSNRVAANLDLNPEAQTDDRDDLNEDAEEKPSFYYVISPTDDVDMPDVIAVRKSSVELIRWQNSLRRRRRRQAKRHDLGTKKKESKPSATM